MRMAFDNELILQMAHGSMRAVDDDVVAGKHYFSLLLYILGGRTLVRMLELMMGGRIDWSCGSVLENRSFLFCVGAGVRGVAARPVRWVVAWLDRLALDYRVLFCVGAGQARKEVLSDKLCSSKQDDHNGRMLPRRRSHMLLPQTEGDFTS